MACLVLHGLFGLRQNHIHRVSAVLGVRKESRKEMTKLEHALALAEQGFWIFPIQSNAKFPPVFSGWQEGATRDSAVIQSIWQGRDYNIGISTSRFREDEALVVVDVDKGEKKNGESSLLWLELEGWELPDTATQSTPRGGRHLIYSCAAPVRQGTSVLGPGLDIRSRGGYIVGSGSTIDDGGYCLNAAPVVPAPEWLIARCGTAKVPTEVPTPAVGIDQSRAEQRAVRYLATEAPLAIEGLAGDECTYKVAARCKDFGIAMTSCFHLMADHWNPRCQPPWSTDDLVAKVHNAYAYGTEAIGASAPEVQFPPIVEPEVIDNPYDKLNKNYAFVIAGSGAHILYETTDAKGRYELKHLDVGAFKLKHAPEKIGKQTMAQAWLEWKGRREYEGLVFMPEQEAPTSFYNLWRGFAYAPADQAEHPSLAMFLDHARVNVCRGDEALFRWLIGYFAHLVQKPWEKPLVSLVFRGAKGVGKNALVERIGALLGGHFLLTSSRRYLIGNFNGHLENCLLFALDEAFWSGDKQAEGVLKDLITGKSHVIEHKGKEPYTVDNKTRVAIIGNEEWLVPASHDERRFAVFDVGDGRKQDREFFTSMREGMERGGYAVLLRYLLDYDLTGYDVNDAPKTKGLADQKEESLNPFEQYWLECLTEGRILAAEFTAWPDTIDCERFRLAFRRYVGTRNIKSRLPEDRSIGRSMKKIAPSVDKKRLSTKNEEGIQPYAYVLPPIDACRAEWEKYIGHVREWPT